MSSNARILPASLPDPEQALTLPAVCLTEACPWNPQAQLTASLPESRRPIFWGVI